MSRTGKTVTPFFMVLLMIVSLAFTGRAAIIYFTPSPLAIAAAGDAGSIDLMVGDLGSGEDISAFDLTVTFDPSVLSLETYSFGNELGTVDADALDVSFGVTGAGSFNIAETSLFTDPEIDFSFQPDVFKIATLTFRGLMPGSSTLGVSGSLIDGWGLAAIPFTTIPGSASVPEPTLFPMLLSGLLFIPLIRRKKHHPVC